MTDRLSFAQDASGEYDSMLAFAVPLDSGSKRDQVMSISSRLLPWEVATGQGHDYFPGGNTYGHFEYYKRVYQLDQVHFGEDIRAAENMEFISNVQPRAVSNTHPTTCPLAQPSPNLLRIATSAGLRQQLPLLRRPAPRLLGVVEHLLRAHARTGTLRPRRHPGRRMRPSPCLFTTADATADAFTPPPLALPLVSRRPAGAAESRSPWTPLATPWSHLRPRPTPSWPSRSAPSRRS